MKKILFFIESLAGGGAEKVLSDLVANLDPTKYDITVMTVTDGDIYQEKIKNNCRYLSMIYKDSYQAGSWRSLLYRLKLKLIYKLPTFLVYRIYIRERYDIEIAFVEGFATKLIASSTNKQSKKIAWVHIDMQKYSYADKFYKNNTIHIDTYRKYQHILCVSESVRKAFCQKFFESEIVKVQYNPVDEKDILRLSKESLDKPVLKRPLLVSVGRLEHQKGYLRLIECVNRLKKEGYSFEIWIIGDGSEKIILEKKIFEYHLEDIIYLTGFQKNPYKYIQKSDAFICSSYAEGFSTAATESLILEKPIFTVDCAGMRELFGDENCGMIVDNTDECLYEMLKNVVSGTVSFNEYLRGLKRRSSEFKISKNMQQIQTILDDLE